VSVCCPKITRLSNLLARLCGVALRTRTRRGKLVDARCELGVGCAQVTL
jgi:hypothetical protein